MFFVVTAPRQSDTQATDVALLPIVFGHFLPVRAKPRQILDVGAIDAGALKELPATKDRMGRTQHNQRAGEGEERLLLTRDVPIEPADLIVLAVGVVFPLLRPPNFIASANHRYALRQQESRQHIALLPSPQFPDGGIISRPFDT